MQMYRRCNANGMLRDRNRREQRFISPIKRCNKTPLGIFVMSLHITRGICIAIFYKRNKSLRRLFISLVIFVNKNM